MAPSPGVSETPDLPQLAARAEACVRAAASAPVLGELAGLYAALAVRLGERLVAERAQLALPPEGRERGTRAEGEADTRLVADRLVDLHDDAARLLGAAPLLGAGQEAFAAWRGQTAALIQASSSLETSLRQAVALGAERLDAAEFAEVRTRAGILEAALRSGGIEAGRALAAAEDALAGGLPAPAAAVSRLAEAQSDTSEALDDAVDHVFLAALERPLGRDKRPGVFARRARREWDAERAARRAALVAFDAANRRWPAASAAADLLDPEAEAGGSLDLVSPASVAHWWAELLAAEPRR
ncbi:hypothetical protein DWB68_05045 [Galactobacter valiniphilus]|uniref:Uncharacterized protein n=1 Tax=Galactobacter valiniphilus TaxID=2676122 RepID=A0A399JEC8_9MICC|nr:hypothetical protein [Galactobacter valiniphilus]RII42907.1 hypothetical protein DWB68_05045 [Galactobacter valiniphilus]